MYLNQNRRIIKYCWFQFLSLSINIRWIKWRKVRVSMYVKVLHSPIIIFYWNFFSKELLNLYFTTAIKRNSVKIHWNIFFRLIFTASEDFGKVSEYILRQQIEFVSSFILLQSPSTNYSLRIRNFFYLAISDRFIFYKVFRRYKNLRWKQFNSKTLMQCITKYISG